MAKWKNKKIKIFIHGDDGNPVEKNITAAVYSCFAIHENENENCEHEPFTLTHVPSGHFILHSTIGRLQRAAREFKALPWHLVKNDQEIPDGFDFEKFKSIQSCYSV